MLVYILAIAIALISFAFYMAAFFFPEVHREDDFLWSGVGLFYALVLWVCARSITGGVLLGQIAAVALLVWFGWETLTLRRAIAHPETRTEVADSFSLTRTFRNTFGQVFSLLRRRAPEPKTSPQETTASLEATPSATVPEKTTEPETTPIGVTPETTPQPTPTEVTTAEQGVTEVTPETTPQPAPTEVTTAEQKITEATQSPLEETTEVADQEQAEPQTVSETQPDQPQTTAKKQRGTSFTGVFGRLLSPFRRNKQAKSEPKTDDSVESESATPGMLETAFDDDFDELEKEPQTDSETPQATPPSPPSPESVEAAPEEPKPPQIDVEAVAPEAQLTPPAETEVKLPQSGTQPETKAPEEPQTDSETPQATPPSPPSPESVEAAIEEPKPPQIDVEAVAPEAQLTPPAEPIGDSDPETRQNLRESAGETPSGLEEKPENPSE